MGLYIYGAGRVGRLIEEMLADNGYAVEAFIDVNAENLHYKDYSIIRPDAVKVSEDIEIIVALAMGNVADSVKKYFENKGCRVVLWSDERLRNMLCPYTSSGCERCAFAMVCPQTGKESQTGGICLESLSVSLTTRCSLNCKFCSALVPMARQKKIVKDLDVKDFANALDILGQYVEEIHEYSIVGGEPLLNKDICSILDIMLHSKIGFRVINILTNGTIPLPENLMEYLKNDKIKVTIDYYGDKLNEREKMLVKENIHKLKNTTCNYAIIDNTNGTWYNYGDFEDRKLSEREMEQRFAQCLTGGCVVLTPECYLGRCGRHMASISLFGGIPGDPEYVDLLNGKENIKDKLTEIIEAKTLMACNYCNGFQIDNIVSAGEQERI